MLSKNVHLYLITDLSTGRCFNNPKQSYKFLCDECFEKLDKVRFGHSKETKVNFFCDECVLKVEEQ